MNKKLPDSMTVSIVDIVRLPYSTIHIYLHFILIHFVSYYVHIHSVNLLNNENIPSPLRQKDHIKYLGVMIDDQVPFKQHMLYVCSRLSRNTEILLKRRHFLPLQQLKQLYYSLIYPCISYAIVA